MKRILAIVIMNLIVSFTMGSSNNYEFKIWGYALNYPDNFEIPNQLIYFEIPELQITDSVFTDSTGYYEKTFELTNNQDSIIAYELLLYTIGLCNFSVTENYIVLTTFNGQLRLDLSICENSEPCFTNFFFEILPSNTVQFYDESMPEIVEWIWDFGDGNTSNEQHPLHQYKNEGLYTVILTTTTTDSCTSNMMQEIYIPSNVIINGQVFMGSNPLKQGRISHSIFDDGTGNFELVEDFVFNNENGYFMLSMASGNQHLIKVTPQLNVGKYYFPEYFPTYFGNSITWKDAQYIDSLPFDSIVINLQSRNSIFYGHGTISCNFDFEELLTIMNPQMCVFLLNENFNPVKYLVTDFSPFFELTEIPTGQYYLLIDLPGIGSEPIPVSITENNLEKNIYLRFDGQMITHKPDNNYESIKVYPIPTEDKLNIAFPVNFSESFTFQIKSANGKILKQGKIEYPTPGYTININEFASGIYYLHLISANENILLPIIKQ